MCSHWINTILFPKLTPIDLINLSRITQLTNWGKCVFMKKSFKILLMIATIILVVRLLLPYIIKDYVNQTINKMEGYKGNLEDINLSIIRGAYVIKGLSMERTNEEEPITFVNIEQIDLSVEWKALFKGKVAGEIIIFNPELSLKPAPEEEGEPDTTNWKTMVKDLMPLQINRFEIKNGKINFLDYQTDPEVEVYLHDLNLVATNISNVNDANDPLPAALKLSGTSIGGGSLNLDMKINFLQEIPNLDMELQFENIDLTAFNSMTMAYANFEIDTGALNIYSEAAIRDGILNGYVKPILDDVTISGGGADKDKDFFQRLWEGAVEVVKEIIENPEEEQVATLINFTGDLNNPDTPVWPTVINIFRNAFIEAFAKQLEGTIDFEQVNAQNQQE